MHLYNSFIHSFIHCRIYKPTSLHVRNLMIYCSHTLPPKKVPNLPILGHKCDAIKQNESEVGQIQLIVYMHICKATFNLLNNRPEIGQLVPKTWAVEGLIRNKEIICSVAIS